MKELVDKISSYNLFNYLFPGILFVLLAKAFTSVNLVLDDLVLGVFLYYFVGLVISRVGSLLLEPVLKRTGFVKFSAYEDYVAVSKKDPVLAVLSEANNMYRTLLGLFVALAIVVVYDRLAKVWMPLSSFAPYLIVIGLLLLFAFSYRKQTDYVSRRVEAGKAVAQKGGRETQSGGE